MSRVGLSTCSPLRAVLYEKFVMSEFDPEFEVHSTSRSRKFVKFAGTSHQPAAPRGNNEKHVAAGREHTPWRWRTRLSAREEDVHHP